MLVLQMIRWVIGYVEFEVIGVESHRLLSSASARGYHLWRMEKLAPDRCRASIAARDYPGLRKIARKRRLRLRVRRRVGLPFLARQWRRSGKHGLFLGAACAVVLLCVLSSRVWVITVAGNVTLSADEIKAAAAQAGLSLGTVKTDYDPVSIENQILLRYPEITWISVNNWGSTVSISVLEGELRPEVADNAAVGNVTASRAGQIVSMEVYQGKTMVALGDGVAPGQLLVSGVVEHENGGVSFTKATAKIIARTRRQFTVTVPAEEPRCRDTGRRVTRRSASIFGVTIPLTLQGVPEGAFQKSAGSHSVTVNGVELPITIYEEVYTGQQTYHAQVSEQEARERGLAEIRNMQEETLAIAAGDGSVESEKVTVTAANGEYQITSDCVCLENIAQEQPFYVELEEENAPAKAESDAAP